MLRKMLAMFLVVTMIVSVSACGSNETTTDMNTGNSTTQSQTDETFTSSTEQSIDAPGSTTASSDISGSTSIPSSTTGKPNTTTKPKTTKPSTPAHTHSYADATCTEPAKCSCGATRGSALGHTYVNDYCVVCNKKNPDSWQFKNGGNDHIIKYNNATSQKINIDTKHFDLPADDPNGEYIIVYEIQRNHIAQIGEWIYFEEKIDYHNEYIKETESGNYGGIGGSIHKLCRIKLDGTMFEEISTVSAKSGERLACTLGFDGNTMYFLKNYGYEPGGNICAVDLSKKYNNIIDDAIVYNRSILFPLSSYIENGIIYLKEDPDYGGGTSEIAIASLK